MVTANKSQLHHRTVNSGHVLPTTTAAPTPSVSNDKTRRHASGGNLLSRQSLLILLFGTMLGYVVVPIFLVETTSLTGDVITKNKLGFIYDQPSSDPRQLGADDIMERLIQNKKLLSTQSLPTDRAATPMETAVLSDHRRKKILVTGGAGFVGSHLVDKLMMEGHEVTVVDNFFTGQKKNIAHWMHHPNFR